MGLIRILLGFCIFHTMVMSSSSCVSNNEEELYPCDTLNITYTATIAPIINHNCLGCHNAVAPSSGIPLEGHPNLFVAADNGTLVGALKHLENYVPMPEDGSKLPACDIKQIELWVMVGAPNN